MSWHTLLVLGGIGSGRSGYAESLLAEVDGPRQVVTAGPADDLTGLARVLTEAKPDETLLVEDVAAWALGGAGPPAADPAVLAEAARACPARLVLVSPEVGLSLTPSAATSRARALALGTLNQALADAADAVVLVVAGRPVWLKGGDPVAHMRRPATVTAAPEPTPADAAPGLSSLKSLPAADDDASAAATAHLARLGTLHLGALSAIVGFAAGAQGTAPPVPWRQVRAVVLHGDHTGGASAGAPGSAWRAAQLRDGTSPIAQLAGAAGVSVQVVEVAAAAAIEDGPAMSTDAVEQALGYGWRLAEQAADEGVDAIVLGAIGDGSETAAAAVVAVLATNAEPASLLARVRTHDGMIDDQAWIRRCAAVRDAVHRVRSAARTTARPVLAELAGPDIATATGLILGAAARRTPVLLDGPVGAAAAMAARGLAAQSKHWCLLPDHNGHPTVVRVAEVLGLTPLLDLRLELGEGAATLAAMPLLRSALTLAITLSAADQGEIQPDSPDSRLNNS
jgi:nicotinate-nucleotide--dimethylbenzimidazole phosphoribosyltransferase